MCGILGGNNKSWDYEKALQSIQYRGPDGMKITHTEGFSLGFVRLSIIDLSNHAMQPMSTPDGTVQIVFNGEIYNYKKIKEKLQNNYEFKTASDTEVILAAYMTYGDKFVRYIDGMFAIAIYDGRTKKVKLFRDRVGIKPLYYFYDGKNFAFCSELKGLISLKIKDNYKIDYTALYDFLTYNYIPEPKSMYKLIFKLKPASWMEYDISTGVLSKQRDYWNLKINCYQEQKIDIDETSYQLERYIHNSINQQLNADVSVGVFLSGGIDSSIVACEVKKINEKIVSYSLGFTDRRYSELKYANMVAQFLDIEIKTGEYNRQLLEKEYSKIKNWFDEPFSDSSCYPTFWVSQLAGKDVKVVLTGDGGDELFGGYQQYKLLADRLTGKNKRIISNFYQNYFQPNTTIEDFLLEDLALYAKYSGFLLNKKVKRKYAKKWNIPRDYDDYWFLRQYYNKELPVRTRLQYMDFNSFLRRVLVKVDRTSMQNSVEARVPLLSKNIIEYAFSLPEETRFYQNKLKGILKHTYKNKLPKEILNREKKGFTLPPTYMKKPAISQQEELLLNVWNL